MSGGVRWTPGGGNLLPALIPPEPLSASTVWGIKDLFGTFTVFILAESGKPMNSKMDEMVWNTFKIGNSNAGRYASISGPRKSKFLLPKTPKR